MSNPNPYQARQAKKAKHRCAGNVGDVKVRLWQAVEAACDVLADPETDPALRLRAVHAVTQATASYTRVLEAAEFEARLRALEGRVGDGDVL